MEDLFALPQTNQIVLDLCQNDALREVNLI